MTDTATETGLVLVPTTGEQVALNAPTDELAAVIDFLRDVKRQADTAIRVLGDELLRRMDTNASWTAKTERFEIVGQSPTPDTEWNVDALDATLKELIADGEISEDAYDNALETVVTLKVRKRGIDALRKLNDDIRLRIDSCGTPVEKTRRVNVKLRKAA